MATLRMTGFSGEIPKLLPRLLPDNAASACFNVRLDDGGLTPIRRSQLVHTFTPAVDDDATIYRHNDEWLSFPGLTDIEPGPVATDRLYITGDGVPKMRVDGTTYPLAITPPATKLTATVSGTPDANADEVTRLYVYTFVTEFGEESEPCPISDEVSWTPGEVVSLSGFEVGDATRGVDRQRIYRSQSGQTGTDLFFIAERDASATDFTDDVAVDDIQEVLPSLTWTPPVDTLEGITALPNGMMAAFSGKDLYFCEPYRPHAWPDQYALVTDYPIVGLGAFGNTTVVVTEGNPYVVTGTAPESMKMEKLELNLPCINKRGVVDLGYGVAYPSHDGLVLASRNGAQVITASLFSRDDWLRMEPQTFAAGHYDGRYYASYDYLDFRGETVAGTIIIDTTDEQPFIIRTSVETHSFYYEIESGKLFYLSDGNVYEWDSTQSINTLLTWRSKEYVLPRPTNFGAILVEVKNRLTPQEQDELEQAQDDVIAENEVMFNSGEPLEGDINGAAINVHGVNGDILQPVPKVNRTVNVNVYADGVLVASVTKYNRMARLPSGFKARRWQIEVSGDMPVEQVALATTGTELMAV